MKRVSLNGFQLCHVSDSMNGVLREKRIMAGLTQKQVADRAGITLQQYQKFESGERNIMNSSFQIACRVIEALGMNISEFYHGEYTFGEKVVLDKEGLKYTKTGKLVSSDVEETIAEKR